FSSRRRHTRFSRDWSSDVCSSDLNLFLIQHALSAGIVHRGEGVLNQVEISRLGGESGFNALRRALRTGHAVGGMAGRPALSPMGLTPASPNVAFNIINQGEPMQATQRGAPRWNGEQWVIEVVMERVRNSQGIRNQLREALSN